MKSIPVLILFLVPCIISSAFIDVKNKTVAYTSGKIAVANGTILVAADQPMKSKVRRCVITSPGAVGDGKTLNTKAFQAVIDRCAKKGGTVAIPKGDFLSGSIVGKAGVNLEIEKGGVLITLKNVEVSLKSTTLELGNIKELNFENVLVDGVPMPTPAATVAPAKTN